MQDLQRNQHLISSESKPSQLALRGNNAAQSRLDELLAGCFMLQKLYGKQPENIGAVNQLFHSILANQPADKVIRAFELWIERSQEFPTPADIIGLIKRNGRPPLSKEMYISISKMDAENRTGDDWAYLRDYEAEQRDEAFGSDLADPVAMKADHAELTRLRSEVARLNGELVAVNDLLHHERMRKGVERPKPDQITMVRNTLAEMRHTGAAEIDMEEFAAQYGMTLAEAG
jgi:hypothetical protein